MRRFLIGERDVDGIVRRALNEFGETNDLKKRGETIYARDKKCLIIREKMKG